MTFVAVAACAPAWADVIPEPSRPGWKDHAPPEPEFPDEGVARRLAPWAAAAVAAALGGAAWRRRSPAGRRA